MYNRQFHIAPGACVVYTMTATVIVPGRETPCSQWISFNGDNEPVLNTSPDVDDSCDTFLRRLQRSKLIRQNDPNLPSGQQFCFEAMVDKRYNRWKRRRRKKQSEARRICITQSSESSDENDERNTAMERIIDNMYEEIHGPVPHTPNGSRDTPRLRNRRRREEDIGVKTTLTYADSEESNPLAIHCNASSEWNSSDGFHLSSASACQMGTEPTAAPTPETEHDIQEQSSSGNMSDDLCSWPYLEQYKNEIHVRLQTTSPDQMEEMGHNYWLPGISNHDNEDAHDRDECGNISEQSRDTDTATPDEYESYTRVDETTHLSPVPVSPVFNGQYISGRPRPHQDINSSNQTYAYAKLSRSQRSLATKVNCTDERQQYLSRTSATSWSEIGYDPITQECINVTSLREKDMDQVSFRPIKSQELMQVPIKRQELVQAPIKRQELVQRPIKHQELVQAPRDRLAKKSQKVALDIKKQNVNLPPLTKSSRPQTIQDTSRRNSTDRLDRSRTSTQITKAKPKAPTFYEETSKTKQSTYEIQPRSTTRESQTMPEFIFRDYYLRNMYGSKIRINSHSDSYKNDKTLRKALTVEDLDIRHKKKSNSSKTDDLNFTRSFTFSMFDLPKMHKLYNTALGRRASGEDVEGYE